MDALWTFRAAFDDSDWMTAHVPQHWSIDDTPNWWLNDQFSEWEDQGQEAPDYDGKFQFPSPYLLLINISLPLLMDGWMDWRFISQSSIVAIERAEEED